MTARIREPRPDLGTAPGLQLPIIPGPVTSENAGSFTRFVLPFAYRLEAVTAPGVGNAVFVESRPGCHDADRLLYLSSETSRALFGRTRWFRTARMTANEPEPFPRGEWDHLTVEWGERESTPKADRTRIVRLDAPLVVLFEAPENPDALDDLDVLRTGFLVLDAWFDPSASPQLGHLMAMNECFRMWRRPYPKHEDNRRKIRSKRCTNGRIYFDPWDQVLRLPVRWPAPKNGRSRTATPPKYYRMVSDLALRQARAVADGKPEKERGFVVNADERAFVWTCACIARDRAVASLRSRGAERPDNLGPPPQDAGRPGFAEVLSAVRPVWSHFLNVDFPYAGPSGPGRFERAWSRRHTYYRWVDSGSWYGYCAHAGAHLTFRDSPEDVPTYLHFHRIYFDMTLLLLYVRATVFRFSDLLASQSSTALRESIPKERHFPGTRSSFLLFSNAYALPILSTHQQGVELYTLARENFDVTELYGELREKMRDTQDALEASEQLRIARDSRTLASFAAVGVFVGTAIGIIQALGVLVGSSGPGPDLWDVVRVLVEVLVLSFGLIMALRYLFHLWTETWPSRRKWRVCRWLGRSKTR